MFLKRYLNYHRIVKPLLLISLIFGAIIFFLLQEPIHDAHRVDIPIYVNDIKLETMVVNTRESRNLGLSNHSMLAHDEAMLFVFDRVGMYPFWMKDMDFPIDIFWLNKDKQVVFIQENASPNDYPESYNPKVYALYVVETVAGFSEKENIKIGSQFSWE